MCPPWSVLIWRTSSRIASVIANKAQINERQRADSRQRVLREDGRGLRAILTSAPLFWVGRGSTRYPGEFLAELVDRILDSSTAIPHRVHFQGDI